MWKIHLATTNHHVVRPLVHITSLRADWTGNDRDLPDREAPISGLRRATICSGLRWPCHNPSPDVVYEPACPRCAFIILPLLMIQHFEKKTQLHCAAWAFRMLDERPYSAHWMTFEESTGEVCGWQSELKIHVGFITWWLFQARLVYDGIFIIFHTSSELRGTYFARLIHRYNCVS